MNTVLKKPTRNELNEIDMADIVDIVHSEMQPFVVNDAGKDHYRLLRYIGRNFMGSIYEVGTHRGASSTSLSEAVRKIITYDIQSWEKCSISTNEYRVKNPLEDIKELSLAGLIFYDTAHDGVVEREFMTALENNNFNGIVVLDDIYLNDEMKSFWNDIKQYKEDWTDVGHWSGTGVVYFNYNK